MSESCHQVARRAGITECARVEMKELRVVAEKVKGGPISIAVVDDNVRIGESIQRWLTDLKGYRFLGSYTSAEAALKGMSESPPHVALVDIEMPGTDSFELLSKMGTELPRTKVVMLSGHVQHSYIERALHSGAAGYIVKDEGIPAIVDLVKRAAEGEIVLSPTARDSLGAGR